MDVIAPIKERIQLYSAKYFELFRCTLDIEKVWEIAQLQATNILSGCNREHRHILIRLLADCNASIWTRAISGASLVHDYFLLNEEAVAVEQLIRMLSPVPLGGVSLAADSGVAATDDNGNDLAILSTYALNICTRIHSEDLLKSLLESLLSELELFFFQTSSNDESLRGKMCVGVLFTLITRGAELNSDFSAVISKNIISIMRTFLSMLYCKNESPSTSRELVVKRLIAPLLSLVGSEAIGMDEDDPLIEMMMLQCSHLGRDEEKDFDSSSSILCMMMSTPRFLVIKKIGRNNFWQLISSFFLSSDVVVRKRAAFIMQLLPNGESNTHQPIPTEDENASRVPKERKGKKSTKAKNTAVEGLVQVSTVGSVEDTIIDKGPLLKLNGIAGKRAWWADFLDVYGQIEGCTSMHLVDQIWSLMSHLCSLAAITDSTTDTALLDEGNAGDFCYPTVNFFWIKSLLHILLQISIPGIRKAVFRRILLGGANTDRRIASDNGLHLNANRESINWVCTELFPLVDTVNFFSAYFLPVGVPVGCGELEDSQFDSLKINVLAHPGILMPSFLARMLRALADVDKSMAPDCSTSTSLVSHLICSIVHAVCGEDGLHSLSAAKWIFRVFAEPSILPLIPRCLGPTEVREISAFLRGRLACSNGVVREHVLQGLLPLFLRGVRTILVPLSQVLSLVTGNSCFDIDRIVTNVDYFHLLRDVVMSSIGASLNGECAGSDAADLPEDLLAIGYTIAANYPVQTGVSACAEMNTEQPAAVAAEKMKELCKDNLKIVTQLYQLPYLDREQQLRAIKFLIGISRTVLIAHSASQRGQSVNVTRLPRLVFPLLRSVLDCASDIASYLSIAIVSCHTAAVAELRCITENMRSGPLTPVLIDDVHLLDDCTAILGVLLLIPTVLTDAHDTSHSNATNHNCVVEVIIKTLDSLAALLSSASCPPLSDVLIVRCLNSLMNSIQAAWSSVSADVDTMQHLLRSVSNIVQMLILSEGMSSVQFRSYLGYIDSEGNGSGKSITIDLVRVAEFQFGRVSTMYVEHRWATLRVGLEILVSVNYSSQSGDDVSKYSDSAMQSDYHLFSQVISQLDSCSMLSLPDMLSCCHVVARRLWNASGVESRREKNAELLVTLLDSAWRTASGGSAYIDVKAINSFIRLAFDASVLRTLDTEDALRYYDLVEALGLNNRPHFMQSLVFALCSAWSVDVSLSTTFFFLLPRLLLYREPKQDDHNIPDNTGNDNSLQPECSGGSRVPSVANTDAASNYQGVCRFTVLMFLETCLDKEEVITAPSTSSIQEVSSSNTREDIMKASLDDLIKDLMALNLTEDFKLSAMIGSDLYGRKLRCWQALCVLTRHISEPLLLSVLDTYFSSLAYSAGHGIRVYMELFGAAMAMKYPAVLMPRLLTALQGYNYSQQTLCSLFMVLGHTVYRNSSAAAANGLVALEAVDRDTAQNIVSHLLPWVACGAGLPRTVAQLLMHSLIPLVIDVSCALTHTTPHNGSKTDSGDIQLLSVFRYLSLNKESVKGMAKQRTFFATFSPSSMCSVRGLTTIGPDSAGEVVAPHILTFLAESLKSEEEEGLDAVSDRRCQNSNNFPIPRIEDQGSATLQTKRVPFDELQLSLQSDVLSRQRNAAGRKRQEVVVCASLIDKVTNLAGIART